MTLAASAVTTTTADEGGPSVGPTSAASLRLLLTDSHGVVVLVEDELVEDELVAVALVVLTEQGSPSVEAKRRTNRGSSCIVTWNE